MAAELGTMKVTEQVDALRSLAHKPHAISGGATSTRDAHHAADHHDLEQWCRHVGRLHRGGFQWRGTNIYWQSFQDLVTLTDQWTGLLKTIPFALIISLIGCRQGLNTSGGAEGVGTRRPAPSFMR
jgi:phospholipid/cholesterol/gamma-HCH transport system permease protein